MRHVILTDAQVELIERMVQREKDSIAHLMAVNVLGKSDDTAAREHFHTLHVLANGLKDMS